MNRTPTKLEKAKAQLVLDHPFFASILLRRKMAERRDIPILAIDKRGVIYYHPENIEKLAVPQIVWGLAHECLHYMGQHAARMQGRQHKKWNYATDAWINDTLTTAGVGQAIENTVNMPGSKDKTCEDIYAELPDDPNGGGQGSGQGQGQGDGLGDDILDEGGNLTDSEIAAQEAQAKIEIAEAAQAAKMRGKLPAALQDFISDFLESKTPWYDILERHMVAMTAQEQSWMRPNRRFIGAGDYLPSTAKSPSMGTIACVVDVSGSVSQQELAYYSGHLARIVEQCCPEKVEVLYVDTQCQRRVTFEQGEDVSLQFYSGGGTHMPAAFDYCDEEGIDPDVMVFLTDGYTDFGQPPAYPVIWCISSQVSAPWGENVHFDMEH